MALRVNSNIKAINAQRIVKRNLGSVGRELERLSSGLRVNRAADDASGLAISEGMRGEISGLSQNVQNAEHATNLIQVAEGSLQEVSNILIRMRELAVQSSSSTLNNNNREAIVAEFASLRTEIDRIAESTTYNKQSLLVGFGNRVSDSLSTTVTASNTSGVKGVLLSSADAGTYTFEDTAGDSQLTLGNGTVTQTINVAMKLDSGSVATGATVVANFDRLGIQVSLAGSGASNATGSYAEGDLNGQSIVIEESTGGVFQVGPTDRAVNRIEVGIRDLRSTGDILNLDEVSMETQGSARQALSQIDSAIARLSNERGQLGAAQNRLSYTIAYSENELENIQASEATIRDADVANEITALSRAQILVQSSTAMLAQANVSAVSALSLL
ncbi:MAG: flagellin [Candidatus Latescibacterota bacterium]|nr:flagellin [Candidatus Latescibacterota bacterium]MEE2627840.1 flagellin [Candidatus Latescibacterota bacterium]MEE2728515.1 flagellin [Candidatus Latescibacterota bacterium]